MRRPALAAAALLALLASPGHGAPFASCLVVSDPAGDVTVEGTSWAPYAVPDQHADVLAAYVSTDRTTLTVRLDVAKVSEFRYGEWRLSFTTRGRQAYVEMVHGAWLHLGSKDYGSRAGLVGGPATGISPTIDYGSSGIHVRVPLSAFAPATPRPRDVLTAFAVTAREMVVTAGPFETPVGSHGRDVALVDSGESGARHTVGRRC